MPDTATGGRVSRGESHARTYKITEGPSHCTARRHGDEAAHASGCRCLPARRDHARREKARKYERMHGHYRLIDATGTHRRLRALMAIGWRARDLAPRIGWSSGELDTLFRRATVHRDTARAVTAVYQLLADHPGPSVTTRRRAERAGYLPPIWWDDDLIDDPAYDPRTLRPTDSAHAEHLTVDTGAYGVADVVKMERHIDGDYSERLTPAEKSLAVQRLLEQGYTRSVIGQRLRMSGTDVRRYAERAYPPAHFPSDSVRNIDRNDELEEAAS